MAESEKQPSQTTDLIELVDAEGKVLHRVEAASPRPAWAAGARPRHRPPGVENWPHWVEILEVEEIADVQQGYGTDVTVISREQAQALLEGKAISFSVQNEYGAIVRLWQPGDETAMAADLARIEANRRKGDG